MMKHITSGFQLGWIQASIFAIVSSICNFLYEEFLMKYGALSQAMSYRRRGLEKCQFELRFNWKTLSQIKSDQKLPWRKNWSHKIWRNENVIIGLCHKQPYSFFMAFVDSLDSVAIKQSFSFSTERFFLKKEVFLMSHWQKDSTSLLWGNMISKTWI